MTYYLNTYLFLHLPKIEINQIFSYSLDIAIGFFSGVT